MESLLFCLEGAISNREGDLAQRLRSHDPQALADLFDLYGRVVFGLILRIVKDTAVAEDLVQESYFRVWTRATQLNSERTTVGPWLMAVARNCALDYRKSIQARFVNSSTTSDFEYPPVRIEAELLNSERARILQEAFFQLSPVQRRVIELAYYEGLTQTEIAKFLNQPLGTVKSWTRSALQKLRSELEPECEAVELEVRPDGREQESERRIAAVKR